MNKNLFNTKPNTPVATAINDAGGTAYAMTNLHALAQYAMTGCMGGTYYVDEHENLQRLVGMLDDSVPSEFIAKLAVISAVEGYLKDMPAFLLACLHSRGDEDSLKLMSLVFPRCIHNTKMLRNFVQVVRSGTFRRKSFGSFTKKVIQRWLCSRSPEALFQQSIGQDPSLADVIKMVHPHATSAAQSAVMGYLIGNTKALTNEAMPELVRQYEALRRGETKEIPPKLNFQFLTSLELTTDQWKQIGYQQSWQTIRMNLNTFERHGCMDDKKFVDFVVQKLRDEDEIKKAKVFPYQLFAAYINYTGASTKIKNALQDAMEIATRNVPTFDCPNGLYVAVDVSGSMSSPVTGKSNTRHESKVRCIDAAALMASCILRNNENAEVIPFEGHIVSMNLNARDSVVTNATKLADIGGGSTNCSSVLKELNRRNAKGDLVVYLSDNESWVDSTTPVDPSLQFAQYGYGGLHSGWCHGGGTATITMNEWTKFKKRNPKAKLVCIDIVPNKTTQVTNGVGDILNVGGFNDNVFKLIQTYLTTNMDFVHQVTQITLDKTDSVVVD